MSYMSDAQTFAAPAPSAQNDPQSMGMVFQIAGSSSKVLIDAQRLAILGQDTDPSVAMAGQVGSQVKMRVGGSWLIASVRAMALDQASHGIVADIDFLGEGDEEPATGRIHRFRRGVTRYPTPGTDILPVSSADIARDIAADPLPRLIEGPAEARIDSYTVAFAKGAAKRGYVIGTTRDGARILAGNARGDTAILDALRADDPLGRPARIAHDGGVNIITGIGSAA